MGGRESIGILRLTPTDRPTLVSAGLLPFFTPCLQAWVEFTEIIDKERFCSVKSPLNSFNFWGKKTHLWYFSWSASDMKTALRDKEIGGNSLTFVLNSFARLWNIRCSSPSFLLPWSSKVFFSLLLLLLLACVRVITFPLLSLFGIAHNLSLPLTLHHHRHHQSARWKINCRAERHPARREGGGVGGVARDLIIHFQFRRRRRRRCCRRWRGARIPKARRKRKKKKTAWEHEIAGMEYARNQKGVLVGGGPSFNILLAVRGGEGGEGGLPAEVGRRRR